MSVNLAHYLKKSVEPNETGIALTKTILSLCNASKIIAQALSKNGLPDNQLGIHVGNINSDGDSQKALDLLADKAILESLTDASIAAYFSEEQNTALLLEPDGKLIVCVDPLDGSSNIDNNLSIGTIFSILPRKSKIFQPEHVLLDALQPGENQLASGFVVYGPQTSLVLTTGRGVASFILKQGEFIQMEWKPIIPIEGNQFAINMSNMRYWPQPVSDYIQACLDGIDGPFAKNYNMRWCGSLVADAWRILRQGGIFLYPEDSRENHHVGRLRLIYEANPVAFLVEQAGGRATDGSVEILKIEPKAIHQRVPLIFGSKEDVLKYESL